MAHLLVLLFANLIIISFFFPELSTCSSSQTFIYVGCTQLRFNPGSPYESDLNSVLTSLVNSAALSNFNSFKADSVSALFQCRGDLPAPDCRTCVATAVSRIGTYCVGTCGAALQLDGCFIKYDNASFVGEQDKTVAASKCGAPAAHAPDFETRRDAVLAYLGGGGGGVDGGGGGGGQYFRVGGSGGVQGMAQCVEDLSAGECGECLAEAIQRLRTECATSPWGDMFLGKCYARYSPSQGSGGGGGGSYARSSESEHDDNDETEKTLALIIGVIAGVTLLIIFISFFTKSSDTKDG